MDIHETNIIFENDDFIIINKPPGLLVHPIQGQNPKSETLNPKSFTLVDWVTAHYPQTTQITDSYSQEQKFGIVHRLDKETSGIMVIAKNQTTFDALKFQFQNHTIAKTYTALVWGNMPQKTGIISLSIAKSKHGTKRTVRRRDSLTNKPAQTQWEVIGQYDDNSQMLSLLSITPKTGRTHQIRVHCAAIGHPVIGDYLYGGKTTHAYRDRLPRVFLHAERISFSLDGKTYTFAAPLPQDLATFLKTLTPRASVAG